MKTRAQAPPEPGDWQDIDLDMARPAEHPDIDQVAVAK